MHPLLEGDRFSGEYDLIVNQLLLLNLPNFLGLCTNAFIIQTVNITFKPWMNVIRPSSSRRHLGSVTFLKITYRNVFTKPESPKVLLIFKKEETNVRSPRRNGKKWRKKNTGRTWSWRKWSRKRWKEELNNNLFFVAVYNKINSKSRNTHSGQNRGLKTFNMYILDK